MVAAMKIKTFSYMSIILTLLLSLFALLPFESHADTPTLTPHGEQSLAQLSECLARDDKNTLNVMYLIDDSQSLKRNDPENIRKDALVSSLEQFTDKSEDLPYLTINRSFATFGGEFLVRRPWQKFDDSLFQQDKNWIINTVPTLVDGRATDWEEGLQGALGEFKRVQSKSSCDLMIWFTDGGINVGDSAEATRQSLGKICGIDPVSLNPTNSALIDEVRRSGIWIQGILLQNESVDLTESERSRMSYFAAVVEQKGTTDPYFFEPAQTTYECGTNVEPFGHVTTTRDPVDIIWPDQLFRCLSDGGRVISHSSGSFVVDKGITRFSVTAFSDSFELKGASGELIAKGMDPANAKSVAVESVNPSGSVIRVEGEVSREPGSVTSPGKWTFKAKQVEKSVVCVYVDIDIQLSNSTCYAGEECTFSGMFTQKGLKANLSSFKNMKLQAGELLGSRENLPEVTLDGTAFKGSFTPKSGISETTLGVVLSFVTESGIEFEVSTKKPVTVIPPGIYPLITPDPVTPSDFSQKLEGKAGKALAKLSLEGPSRTEGSICIAALEVRADAKPERIQNFVTWLDGAQVSSEKCFNLKAGEIRNIELGISNNVPENSTSKGFMVVTYSATGKPDVVSKLDVTFETAVVYNELFRWLLLALLMLLGVGIPLGVLYLVNAANAKIFMKDLYKAEIPVRLNARGEVVGIQRIEHKGNGVVISQDDFFPFVTGPTREKKVSLPSAVLEGKAPKNPFGQLNAYLSTSPGYVVTSSAISSNRGLTNNQAPAKLNPSGLMYVTQTLESNSNLNRQSKDSSSEAASLEANLVVLLGIQGDAYEQVERLNTDITTNAGWLSDLLSPRMAVKPKEPKEKKIREKKKKDKGSNNNPPQQENGLGNGGNNSGGDDDWGSPGLGGRSTSPSGGVNSGGASTPSSDNWRGTGSSGGKNDDW
jgi:hypothetical protein